jgi:peptide chain release factor 3
VSIGDLSDPVIRERLDDPTFVKVTEELEMLQHAGEDFDEAGVLAGKMTPVFFGSGVNNFGVQLLLDGFLKHAPGPRGRKGFVVAGGTKLMEPAVAENPPPDVGGYVSPDHPEFSGFIFKIQANMDPRHRDRIAFLRVVSGRFERDMTVVHTRTGRKVRLSSSHKLFGNERETLDEAYPGDVIGLVGHDGFGIGDTLTTDPAITYKEIPRFTPETFAYLHNPNTAKYKQFRQGLDQLLQEGVIQILHLKYSATKLPVLAAVGPLQFEVVQYRLQSEYGAESRLEPAPWTVVRWLPPEMNEPELDALSLPTGSRLAFDIDRNPVILFVNDWSANYFMQTNAKTPLSSLPVVSRFGS